MDAPDDDALIRRVAEARDQSAFSELYSRHEHAAYSLAVYLTRDTARAEEALQDAMLAVWNDAARYKPGNPRGWLLSIVAQKSIRLKQRQARSEVPMDMATQSEKAAPRDGSLDGLAHREVLESLRALLDKLPERERQLVGLYYAGGLSQDQIAEALRTPQRTVSNRLREILDGLRARLAAQGLAAAAPVLAGNAGGDLLRDAVLTGSRAPQGLAESLLAKTVSATEQSVRAAAAKGGASFIWLAGAFMLAAAGAGGWWWFQGAAHSSATPTPSAPRATGSAEITESAPPPPAAINGPVDRVWTFEKGPAKDLQPLYGDWTWAEKPPGKKSGPGVMLAAAGVQTVIPLNVKIGSKPLLVRLHAPAVVSRQDGLTSMMDAIWTHAEDKDRTVPGARSWMAKLKTVDPRKPKIIETYFYRKYLVILLDGKACILVRELTEEPAGPLSVCLSVKNVAIEKIEVRELNAGELPDPVRDPEATVKAMTVQSSSENPAAPIQGYYPLHRPGE